MAAAQGSQPPDIPGHLGRNIVWFALGMLLAGAVAAVTLITFLNSQVDARIKAFRDQGSLDGDSMRGSLQHMRAASLKAIAARNGNPKKYRLSWKQLSMELAQILPS